VSRLLALLAVLATAGAVHAQTATPLFDEDGTPGDGVYEASEGGAVGNASLVLDGGRLPILSGDAASGADYGALTYAHGDGGGWSLLVGAPGLPPLDLTEADSVVVFLNGPVGVPGVALPRLALQDADGDRTTGVALDFGTRVGFAPRESGFVEGSGTDLAVSVSYVESLPAELARPGYPESIRLTFADTVVATSTASIGFPATPARFAVATEAGLELAFRFVDTDEDGTLSADGEYVEVLTEDPATGRLQRTWRIEAQNSPAAPPAAGDVYRLGVFNGGVDGDPGTWQRRAVAVKDFGPLGAVDAARIVGVVFENAEATTSERTLWIDAVSALAYDGDPDGPAPPTAITAETGDRSVRLSWTPASGSLGVVVFRQPASGGPYERVTPTPVRFDHWFDLDVENGEAVRYVLRSTASGGIGPRIQGPDSAPVEATPVAGAPDVYIEDTARRAFDYFWEEANPQNGLVKDRSRDGAASSIAAVGFGLSAITVAVDRGWITREAAVERTLTTLDFFATCPQGDATSGVCGYRGFFYHFLNMQTGHRAGTNELSTIDTALLLGGVLHAAQYYDGDGAEADIRARADQIWRRVEWDWATPRDPLVALGWRPESGFIGFDWRGYNEAMILYVLGLGSPTHPLDDGAWDGWTSTYDGDWGTFYGYTFLSFPPLFGHQYSHVWIDFRDIQDDYMREKGITYFENSRRATLASRAYSVANPRGFPNYSAEEWGLTASDQPPNLSCGANPTSGYCAHGAPPAQTDNGTITPTAAGGSYAFTPELSREALRTFYARYYNGLWGDYGLKDAYNVAESWFATDYLGIDQGPILLMIENERTGAIWESFMTHPDVRVGLERAGFDVPAVAEAAHPDTEAAMLALPAPNPTTGAVRLGLALAEAGPARLTVHDALGRRVAVVAEGALAAGPHVLAWDAAAVTSGVYVVRLEAAGLVHTRTVVVTR
jgi:hypothetical protein